MLQHPMCNIFEQKRTIPAVTAVCYCSCHLRLNFYVIRIQVYCNAISFFRWVVCHHHLSRKSFGHFYIFSISIQSKLMLLTFVNLILYIMNLLHNFRHDEERGSITTLFLILEAYLALLERRHFF